MIICTKEKGVVGQIGAGPPRKKEATEQFLSELNKDCATPIDWPAAKTDDKNLQFTGELDDKIIRIRLPRGTWDIMASLVPMILKYCPAGDIVEIGMGESTEMFAEEAQRAGVNLYSCDLQMGGMFKVFDEKLFENHHCYIGKSEDFMQDYGGYPSIVFLDGEHLSETVRTEVEFFLPRIRSGGVMFLHDTMPLMKKNIERDSKGYNPGDTYLVRQELERMPEYDVLTWPYSAQNMGLTMVMVHGGLRSFWRENGRLVDNAINK